MAISGNTSTAYGDIFEIRAEVPIVGLIALASFTDTTTGTFDKEFRYSTDGINFSAWASLTDAALAAVSVTSTDNFLIQYRYIATSNSSSFTDITVSGTYSELTCGTTYQNSIFNDFFTCYDNEVLQWCVNVTSKLYKKGIIPEYIKRGEESNINGTDKDYIDFWKSIACFFAYIVVFARQFKDFRQTESLLEEFIRNRGALFCDTQNLTEKGYIVENFFDEIRQRGTKRIFQTKTENNSTIDGELLRALCYDTSDEFIFNLHLPHNIGWSVGNSSPLFQSCENQPATNKAYEDTQNFVDLSLYPTFGNGTQEIIADGSKEVYSIISGEEAVSGLGADDTDYKIVVDPNLDYEISFWVRMPPNLGSSLTFGLRAYNSGLGNSDLLKITDGSVESNFFEQLEFSNTDEYFYVTGRLYNKDATGIQTGTGTIAGTGTSATITGTGTAFESELSIGDILSVPSVGEQKIISIESNTSLTIEEPFSETSSFSGGLRYYSGITGVNEDCFGGGKNLKMQADTNYIIPYIILDNAPFYADTGLIVFLTASTTASTLVGEARIWDLKIKPLKTDYGTGFINPKNFISIWANHKNAELSRNQLESNLRRYLLPYNTSFKMNYLNDDFAISS